MLHIHAPFSALGNDALDPKAPHFAFITEGTNLAFINADGYIRHDRLRTLESSAPEGSAARAQLEQNLLALDKSVLSLFENNRWFTPPPAKP